MAKKLKAKALPAVEEAETAQGLLRRRRATAADKREARRRLREEIESNVDSGMTLDEAVEEAKLTVKEEFKAVDWGTLLPFLIEFIMMLLNAFGRGSDDV